MTIISMHCVSNKYDINDKKLILYVLLLKILHIPYKKLNKLVITNLLS